MSLEKDDYGEYRVYQSFIETWRDRWGGRGWKAVDIREYTDGTLRLKKGKAHHYGEDPPEVSALAENHAMATIVLMNRAIAAKELE
jgi:hypothetical protein